MITLLVSVSFSIFTILFSSEPLSDDSMVDILPHSPRHSTQDNEQSNSLFRQLHRMVLQPVEHLHLITARIDKGAGARFVSTGIMLSSTICHPTALLASSAHHLSTVVSVERRVNCDI